MIHQDAMPGHWKRVQLGDLGDVTGGSTPSTTRPEYWDGDIPWLTPSEATVVDGLYVSQSARTISREGLASCAAKLLPAYSVLMTSRATIGEVVINSVPMATNQGFINLVCDEEKVVPEFMAYWIIRNRHRFEERAHGSTFKEISKSSFKSIGMYLPPIVEQRGIVAALQAARDNIFLRRRETAVLDELFRSMLEDLMSGQLSALPLATSNADQAR
jgi:type I restriction enzyme S subunit